MDAMLVVGGLAEEEGVAFRKALSISRSVVTCGSEGVKILFAELDGGVKDTMRAPSMLKLGSAIVCKGSRSAAPSWGR